MNQADIDIICTKLMGLKLEYVMLFNGDVCGECECWLTKEQYQEVLRKMPGPCSFEDGAVIPLHKFTMDNWHDAGMLLEAVRKLPMEEQDFFDSQVGMVLYGEIKLTVSPSHLTPEAIAQAGLAIARGVP